MPDDATQMTHERPSLRWRSPLAAAAALLAAALAVAAVPPGLYLWVKAVHVMAVISWMAGLLYLPRLFVYHCSAPAGSAPSQTFKVMERRLLRGIMRPALAVTFALGLWLVHAGGFGGAPWLHAKLALVAALALVHGLLERWTADFAGDRNRHTERFYRMVNEVPALLMVAIVIMVVVKPF